MDRRTRNDYRRRIACNEEVGGGVSTRGRKQTCATLTTVVRLQSVDDFVAKVRGIHS